MPTRSLLTAVAVTVTCLVASASYAGAITMAALLLGLVPSLVVSASVAAAVARLGRPRAAAAVGVSAALGAAEIVNLVSGNSNGPAARSTFAAAGFTALAVAAASTRFPTLFLAPVCGVVMAALALGAGAEVQLVAVVTAVLSVVALAVVEGRRRRWSQRPTGRVAAVVLALL